MLSLLHVVPLAVAAHASFDKLPSGNGFGTAVYDIAQAKVSDLREHTYQSVDQGVPTRDILYDTYFGLRAAGQEAWLNTKPVDAADLDGGVITVVQHFGGLTATQTFFAPFGVPTSSLVMAIEVKNEGAQPIADVHAFSLHNPHIGEGDGTLGQRADWNPGLSGFVHRALQSQRMVLVRAITAPAHHSVTPNNPWNAVSMGQLLVDTDSSGDANDIASGFQFDAGTLGPGQSATFAVLYAYHPFADLTALTNWTNAYLNGKQPADLVAGERAQWQSWLGKAKVPDGLNGDEVKLYLQQLAVLRMGQVREPNDPMNGYLPSGQIIASLRPGQWDIAWVRDGCLAIAALARAGYLDEARAALEFMLGATAGLYQQYVGSPYRISVVRYFGKGKEESDSNANGPNIEFDGFGMFLWAASQYLDSGGDPKFLDTWFSTMATGIGDVLVSLVEQNTGLIAADSSIWESHWDNGGRQHYTWTSAWAVAGLEKAAAWADGRDAARAMKYRSTATALRAAIAARLVTQDHVLRPSLENQNTVDAAAIEAFNLGVVDPAGPVAQATLDAIKANLSVASGHGFKRNQNGQQYDDQEWIVIDLRTSFALARAGRAAEGDPLWAWVRDQALLNHRLIPELFDHTTADYAGETPMVGFGAGAFVLTAWDRAPQQPVTDAGPTTDASQPGSDLAGAPVDGGVINDLDQPSPDDGTSYAGDDGVAWGDLAHAAPTPPGGCGCAVGGRTPVTPWASAAALLLLAAWIAKRRA